MSLTSLRTETAVYWEPSAPDGYGRRSFATAIEIKCRWEDRAECMVDAVGTEFVSLARVYPDREIALNGRLYRGTLASITVSTTDPINVEGAFTIRSRHRSQNPNGSIVVHKVYLGE